MTGNKAIFGGGLRNEGSLTVNQSTVRQNSAIGNNGGGINNAGALVMNQSTVAGNTATNLGGGIRNTSAGSCTHSMHRVRQLRAARRRIKPRQHQCRESGQLYFREQQRHKYPGGHGADIGRRNDRPGGRPAIT
ncbi:MAG: hypothetical protein QM813_04230 [Verrucomicrobiota bacterium]